MWRWHIHVALSYYTLAFTQVCQFSQSDANTCNGELFSLCFSYILINSSTTRPSFNVRWLFFFFFLRSQVSSYGTRSCYLLWIRGRCRIAPRGLWRNPVVHSNFCLFPTSSVPFTSPWTFPLSVAVCSAVNASGVALQDGRNDLSRRWFPPSSSAPTGYSQTRRVTPNRIIFYLCATSKKIVKTLSLFYNYFVGRVCDDTKLFSALLWIFTPAQPTRSLVHFTVEAGPLAAFFVLIGCCYCQSNFNIKWPRKRTKLRCL